MAGIDINMGCPKPFSINVSLLDQWTCQSCFAETRQYSIHRKSLTRVAIFVRRSRFLTPGTHIVSETTVTLLGSQQRHGCAIYARIE